MTQLAHLAEWTGPTSSLRASGPYREAILKTSPDDWQASPEAWSTDQHESGKDDDNRPAERLPIFDLRSQRYARGEIVLTSRSLSSEAAALSFMSHGPHDVRPQLLLALFGQAQPAIFACLVHGVLYLQAWCATSRMFAGEAAIQAAAADALSVIYRRRACMPSDSRAKTLGMRAESYRRLRTVMLTMYRRRLREACERFHTGRTYTRESSYSKSGRSSPPALHPPRALPRVIRQQLTLRSAGAGQRSLDSLPASQASETTEAPMRSNY